MSPGKLDRRINLIAGGTAIGVALILLATIIAAPFLLQTRTDTKALRQFDEAARCRSEIAAEDAAALGAVVLIIATASADPTTDRDLYRQQLAGAAETLARTQLKRSQTNEICKEIP